MVSVYYVNFYTVHHCKKKKMKFNDDVVHQLVFSRISSLYAYLFFSLPLRQVILLDLHLFLIELTSKHNNDIQPKKTQQDNPKRRNCDFCYKYCTTYVAEHNFFCRDLLMADGNLEKKYGIFCNESWTT